MIRPLLTSALLITLPLMAAKAAAYEEYIEVTGYGEAEAWPDYLQINMLVSAIDEDAETAKAMVDQSMNQALAVAGGFDIAEEDIRADRITRQPRWEWPRDAARTRPLWVAESPSLPPLYFDKILPPHNLIPPGAS